MQELWKIFVNILAVGGGAIAITYFVFRYLGKSALDHWFKRQIEDYKQKHAAELSRYKTELDALLSGAVRMQELEHHVVPKIWSLLIDFRMRFRDFAKPMFDDKDLDAMTRTELEEFLDTTFLSESQKEKIRSAEKKLEAYKKEIFPMNLRETEKAAVGLQEALFKNRIYLEPELLSKFRYFFDRLRNLSIERECFVDSMTMDRLLEIWEEQRQIGLEIDKFGESLYERFIKKGTIRPYPPQTESTSERPDTE
jgi:hypothetical protein